MKVVFFCHAFTSCWNNGNAHFVRGVARELARFGHEVVICEPADGWSRTNALQDGGEGVLRQAAALRSIWMRSSTVRVSCSCTNGIRLT
jgi:spore maturation protein CgeB